MVRKINQHIPSHNLNYRSEIAVDLIASKVIATRDSLFWYGFHVKKKKKTKRKFSNSIESNGSFTCVVIKSGSAAQFVTHL